MQQTGFLFKIDHTDYITGSSPIPTVIVNPKSDWKKYLPTTEKQYKQATFDTFSCTTFSFLSAIEVWVKYYLKENKFTQKQIETLTQLGFIKDGEVNFSDRYTAIMSGTMPNGNYFQNVGNSVRKDGLLPEQDLPFGGNSQVEYLDKKLITEEMKIKAKKILDILDISYEWTDPEQLKTALQYSPVQGAIPFEATHAVLIFNKDKYFDTYEPFIKSLPVVRYAMKVIVTIKEEKIMPKYKYFTEKEVVGLVPEFVKKLDEAREIAGVPFKIISGFRTPEHNAEVGGVENSAHTKGVGADIASETSDKRFKMLVALLKVGFTRIGINKTTIHVDDDHSLPSEVVWTYYK